MESKLIAEIKIEQNNQDYGIKLLIFQQNEVTFIHVDLKYSEHAKDDVIEYYHVDVKKELPCNRMTKFDSYHSKFIPPNRDLSYNGFKSFTQSVVDGKIQVNKKKLLQL